MGKPHLHAVAAGPATPTPDLKPLKSVTDAVANGTRLDVLAATQAVVAQAIDDPGTPARDLAALARRLLEINKEIDAARAAVSAAAQRGATPSDQPFIATAI